MSELKQLEALFEQMPEGSGKEAVKEKIEKLKATEKSPKEEVKVQESVEEVVEEKPKKTRKPRAKKAAPKPKKATRFVFEKKVEGGKEVKVIEAMSEAEAKEAMEGADFEFVKQITRGRSPREGFVADKKAPAKKKEADKPKRKPRATKDDRTSMAKAAGMSETRAKKISEKVATGKKRGRKPMDKEAWLFEMPLKTQAGKVKRKIVKATNEQAAIKAAGQSYTLIRKLTEGEKPKVGTMDMEGYVAPPKRGRGRPKGVKNKAKAPSKPSEMPSKKSQAAIKAKSEDIGEGIAIADKTMRGSLEYVFDALANLNQHIGKMEREVESMQVEVAKLIGVKPPNQYARGGKTSMVNDYQRERGDIKKASEAMNDHLDKVGMSLFDESRPKSGVYRTMLGRYGWTDFDADVNSKEEFLFESDAIEDFTKYLKKAYPAGKKMAHGGMHGQGYDDKLDESLGMRKGAGRSKQQSRKDRRDESAGMEKSMGRRKYASVGTMDKGRRTMEKGGLAIHFDSDKTNKDEIENLLMDKSYMNDNEYLTDYGSSFYIYADDISPRGVRDAYESIIEDGYDENVELELFAKGGSTEGKPKVESLEEVFLLMDGTEIEYKDIDDAEKMFGGDPLSPQELVDKLAFEGIFVMDYAPELFDLPDGDDEDDDEDYTGNVKDGVTIDDIEDAIEDLLKADNSYNYSAPFVFDVRFNETRDAYDPQVMIVREHRGGDVRGNYGPAMAFYLDNIESNPFYGKMSVEIQTDKGRISLDAESLEGYNFYVNRDETGTFEQDSTIDRDEIAEAFDFGKVKSETLYIND